ncbi:tyrosine-protein phosphatase [Microbacterium sp. ZW T5_56]|uniref:tyrosine-protein phosphatase n=1 Tax=Microbacterium sp. ZW T5_56 TaxID=3378081 RepID=UPI0038543FD8
MTTAQETGVRRYETPGVYNLRDTGGYTAGAGSSRWGRLFRSDALHLLNNDGRALLRDLRIAHIVDLRGSTELDTAPSNVDGLDLTVHHLPVFDEAGPTAQLDLSIGLAPIYDHMVNERGANLAAAIRVIAEAADGEAVLVHCTAGKDRTGLVIAFALTAAGVDRDEVVADYAQTADNLRGEWASAMLAQHGAGDAELPPEVTELITASPAPVLAALLERIDREHGSMRDYLLAQGLTTAELERLTAFLIG